MNEWTEGFDKFLKYACRKERNELVRFNFLLFDLYPSPTSMNFELRCSLAHRFKFSP